MAEDSQNLLTTKVGTGARLLERYSRLPCAGMGLALLSGMIFATGSFIVTLVTAINPFEIVMIRGIIQLIVLVPVTLWCGMPITGPPGKRWTLLMRGLCGAPHLITCYVSFRLMPFADASTIVFAAPVFVSIIGCLLLDEECGIFQILTVTVAMIGVVLISKPQFLMGQETTDDPFKETRTAGTVVALSSSILAASSFLMVRKLKECPAFVIVNYNSLVALVCAGTAILFIRAFFYDEEPEWGQFVVPQTKHDIGLLLGNGMCALVGQVLVTMALRIEEASLVSLARTIDVVMAFIYQMIWLTAEAVQWTSFAGAFLVCSCVSLATLRRWLKDKPGRYDTLWIILNCGIARKQMIQPEG